MKITETLATFMVGCMKNTIGSNRATLVEQIVCAINNVIKCPETTIEDVGENTTHITYKWDDVSIVFVITWGKTQFNMYKVQNVQYAINWHK